MTLYEGEVQSSPKWGRWPTPSGTGSSTAHFAIAFFAEGPGLVGGCVRRSNSLKGRQATVGPAGANGSSLVNMGRVGRTSIMDNPSTGEPSGQTSGGAR